MFFVCIQFRKTIYKETYLNYFNIQNDDEKNFIIKVVENCFFL